MLGSAGLGLFVAALDTYVVVTLLSRMLADLGLPLEHLERASPIITGFLLGYIVTMPLVGALSDRYGRAPIYLLSLGVFTAGSVITATAGLVTAQDVDVSTVGLAWLVTGRVLQGLGGGAMVPVALALAADLYPAGRRAPALGAVAALQESGSVLGPLYGAAVATLLAGVGGWRDVFWINLPLVCLCTFVFLLVRRNADAYHAPADLAKASPPVPVDWRGGILLGLGLGLLVLAFYPDDPSRRAVSPWFLPLLGAAVIVIGVYIRHQTTTATPLLPRPLLRNRAFVGANVTNLLVGAGLMVALVDVPILARGVYGLDQFGAALLLARFMVAIPVGALLGGVLASRLGYRLTAVLGLLVAIVCFVLMSGWGASELSHRILVLGDADLTLFALGLGFGMVIAPVAAAILDRSQESQHGLASSLVVLARSTGMLVGLSALTALGLHRFYQLMAQGPAISFTPGQSTSALTAALNARAAAALLAEYHEIFLVAGLVLTAAAIAAVLTLGDTRTVVPRWENDR